MQRNSISNNLAYIVGFLLLTFFCCWEFGPVVRHLAEENYFCFDALPMTYLLRGPLGGLYWVGRVLMFPFQWQWLGGLYLAVLLTASAWLFDRALVCCKSWRGVSFVLPTLVMGWGVYRGYNLFMRNEPSKLILWVWGLLLVAAVSATIASLWSRHSRKEQTVETAGKKNGAKKNLPYGLLVGVMAILMLCGGTYAFRQNLLISCEMQNRMLDSNWEAMNELALSARQPDRSVAAYNVIAINQMGQVLEHTFDIDYDYPEVKLDSIAGMDEGVNYIAECNFHAGLIQPAYHYALEQMVIAGPRLRYFKLMATCCLFTGESELLERYLHIIGKMPGQQTFVDRIRELKASPEALLSDPSMARVSQFLPREDRFEQNFRTPAFLGYNVGVLSGTDETLETSVAAALYSKDLENIILRASYLQQKRTLPLAVQQALVIASFRRPGLLERFPGIDQYIQSEVVNFANEAKPFADKKAKATTEDEKKEASQEMKQALSERWKGSYMYYYYCGNLNQTAQKKTETAVN